MNYKTYRSKSQYFFLKFFQKSFQTFKTADSNRIFDENILKLFSSNPYISAQKIKLTGISADS